MGKWYKQATYRRKKIKKTQKTNQGVYKSTNSMVIRGRQLSTTSCHKSAKIRVWFSLMK